MKTKILIILILLSAGGAYMALSYNSLETKVNASREYQSDLQKANEKLRKEKAQLETKIKPIQERLGKVNWRINDNKKLWELEKAKQDILLGLMSEM